MRRIEVLMPFAENDADAMAQLSGFMQGLAQLGWAHGRNVRMDLRWAVGSVDRTRMFAKELVDLQPMLAARNNVPAAYCDNSFAVDGGLFSYGPDQVDIFRRAAPYVDRILKGQKPADLPCRHRPSTY